ncbi:MAG: L-glutamate gamma-semialdehyde dehydrogenase [Deltaproteobacteria bacterium]|nr:MAG: L-glutamate gamma-semialdehyde dehydrogenase [Deltaproteobacteria bacterium]
MAFGTFRIPTPVNEPVLSYAPGSDERGAIVAELDRQAREVVEIPCLINGEQVFTGKVVEVTAPCEHRHVLARLHLAGPKEVQRAIEAAEAARPAWSSLDLAARSAVFLKAATLLSGPWRARVNAATMLGQSKTVHQAEIDAAAELCDFWRFNSHFAEQIYAEQPPVSPAGVWNRLEHRPLDGFVFAVSPFNFTSIALNLCTAPALMGNTTVWKPATTSALSCWVLAQLLQDAGLPPGVLNMVNGHGADVGEPVLAHPALAGLHFTGSTGTFQALWRTIGENLKHYRTYPRIVGETGGKDFILAHPTADPEALAVAILRGGYEFQGQKCSAASRIYLPQSLWPEVRDRVVAGIAAFKQGDVRDLSNFVGAVIDERAFNKHSAYLELARSSAEVLAGGEADGSVGWFVEPTFARVDDPKHRLMEEEIFGPIVTAWVYPDASWDQVLSTVDSTSPYALTGALWARDRAVIEHAAARLRYAAGNFYINDKPTGAVVGQQPFGGSRASGTNDKAGSAQNLLRWVSARTLKETFDPPKDWRYPFLG